MKKLWLWLLATVGFLASCSTDIDINADWKETTVVLGVLNTTDSIHYIRIHKAFLDPEKSAVEVADIKDSLYFNSLQVTIEEWKNNAVIRTFNLDKIDTNLLQPGIFHNPSMVLYRFRPGGILDSSSTYVLRINTPSNSLVTSLMQPIGNATSLPNGLPPGGPVSPSFPGLNWTNSFPTINFRAPSNAKVFELTVRIFYDEWNRFTVTPTDTPDLKLQFVDWKPLATQLVRGVNTNEALQIRLNGRNMFAFMNSVLPVNPDLNRRLRGTLFFFDFADDNLNTYLTVNRPSLSVVDVRPTFSNIENGLGIFASRRTIPDLKSLELQSNYPFGSNFFREALGGSGTDSLRIRYPQLNFVP